MDTEQYYVYLFNHHRQSIYTKVFRMTRSHWHAEEIVQEVFLKVWIHREKLAAIRNTRSWLFIITRHTVFDYIAKLSNQRKFLALYKRNDYALSDDALLPIKCQRLIHEATEQLTGRQKQIYRMNSVQLLPKKEIARLLHLSEFTTNDYIKKSSSIVRNYILRSLEMEERRIA